MWQDRLKNAEYTSPSGAQISFAYEDVSAVFKKNTVAYNYPSGAQTYVQDLGSTSRRYPLKVIFWGADCDLQAGIFEAMMAESGIGQLMHPMYGFKFVVPFGEVTRRDDLLTAANQVIFEVIFFETSRVIYPISRVDAGSEVLGAIDAANNAMAEDFTTVLGDVTAAKGASLASFVKQSQSAVQEFLSPIAATLESSSNTFNLINSSLNAGITNLVGEPLDLAFQIVNLVESPARAASLISDRLSAYADLASSLFTNPFASSVTDLASRSIFSSAAVAGAVLSSVNNTFTSKTQAIEAVDAVFSLFDEWVAWREGAVTSLSLSDTGSTYQQLQRSVALTAGFLVELSFTLKQERTIKLDRDRTIIDLCFELYQDLSKLDFLIETNNLTGAQMLELKRGESIVYYI